MPCLRCPAAPTALRKTAVFTWPRASPLPPICCVCSGHFSISQVLTWELWGCCSQGLEYSPLLQVFPGWPLGFASLGLSCSEGPSLSSPDPFPICPPNGTFCSFPQRCTSQEGKTHLSYSLIHTRQRAYTKQATESERSPRAPGRLLWTCLFLFISTSCSGLVRLSSDPRPELHPGIGPAPCTGWTGPLTGWGSRRH